MMNSWATKPQTEQDPGLPRGYSTVTRLMVELCSNRHFGFARIIMDEATAVKNITTTNWRALNVIPALSTGMATATPAVNRVGDQRAYFKMAFNKSKLPGLIHRDVNKHFDSIVQMTIEPTYEQPEEGELSWFKEYTPANQADRDTLKDLHAKGQKWWFLLPSVIDMISDSDKLTEGTDDTAVVLDAFKMCLLNRGMNTKVTLPNGTTFFPQASIPAMSTTTVELQYGGEVGSRIDLYTDKLLHAIGQNAKHASDLEGGGGDESEDGNKAIIATTMVRVGQHFAIDEHAGRLMLLNDPINLAKPKSIEEHWEECEGKLDLLVTGDNNQEPTRLSSTMMQTMKDCGVDHGLGWNYQSLNDNPDHLPPVDRGDMFHYSIAASPVFAWTSKTCAEYARQGKQVLVFTNNAYQQW